MDLVPSLFYFLLVEEERDHALDDSGTEVVPKKEEGKKERKDCYYRFRRLKKKSGIEPNDITVRSCR